MDKVLEEISKLTLLDPWYKIDRSPYFLGHTFSPEGQLKDEAGKEHILFGKKAFAIARSHDNDNVLFHLPDGPLPLAVVNLTHSKSSKVNPLWPPTVLYSSVQEWIEQCMLPDHYEKHGVANRKRTTQ